MGWSNECGGLPGGASGKELTCQCRRYKRCGFDPWVGKISWRRAWKPTPVFLPRKSHGQRILVVYSPNIPSDSFTPHSPPHDGFSLALPNWSAWLLWSAKTRSYLLLHSPVSFMAQMLYALNPSRPCSFETQKTFISAVRLKIYFEIQNLSVVFFVLSIFLL